MSWKSLDDMDLDGKTVLTRVDINVPVENGQVTDTTRIDRIVPTVQAILDKGGKPMLLAHFGRPKGKVVDSMTLRQLVPALEHALGHSVQFIETLDGAENLTEEARAAEVLLLENIRFNPGEEANDEDFARRIAALGDVYCNDAFSAAHRAHASTEALARLLPACAGRLMQSELEALENALGNPHRPLMAVVGGAKVSTKIALLENLVTRVDALVVGGGMANTFLHALGIDVGHSLCEKDQAETARRIMTVAERSGCAIMLPKDAMVAEKFEAGAEATHIGVDEGVDHDKMILDVGPNSVEAIIGEMDRANTLVWNGPLGAFEIPPFDQGTVDTARHAAERTREGMLSVAGGGDTVAALAHAGVVDGFSYVSTAGGAFLEWLEGKPLPGVDALKQAD